MQIRVIRADEYYNKKVDLKLKLSGQLVHKIESGESTVLKMEKKTAILQVRSGLYKSNKLEVKAGDAVALEYHPIVYLWPLLIGICMSLFPILYQNNYEQWSGIPASSGAIILASIAGGMLLTGLLSLVKSYVLKKV